MSVRERRRRPDLRGPGPGFGVAYSGSQGHQALIFDASTDELLGDPNGAGGTANLDSGIIR